MGITLIPDRDCTEKSISVMNSNAKILNATMLTNRMQWHIKNKIYHKQVELTRKHRWFEIHLINRSELKETLKRQLAKFLAHLC